MRCGQSQLRYPQKFLVISACCLSILLVGEAAGADNLTSCLDRQAESTPLPLDLRLICGDSSSVNGGGFAALGKAVEQVAGCAAARLGGQMNPEDLTDADRAAALEEYRKEVKSASDRLRAAAMPFINALMNNELRGPSGSEALAHSEPPYSGGPLYCAKANKDWGMSCEMSHRQKGYALTTFAERLGEPPVHIEKIWQQCHANGACVVGAYYAGQATAASGLVGMQATVADSVALYQFLGCLADNKYSLLGSR